MKPQEGIRMRRDCCPGLRPELKQDRAEARNTGYITHSKGKQICVTRQSIPLLVSQSRLALPVSHETVTLMTIQAWPHSGQRWCKQRGQLTGTTPPISPAIMCTFRVTNAVLFSLVLWLYFWAQRRERSAPPCFPRSLQHV